MTDNLRVLRLYLRADSQVEGLRRQALNRRDDGDGRVLHGTADPAPGQSWAAGWPGRR
jgi:hypothetical protein